MEVSRKKKIKQFFPRLECFCLGLVSVEHSVLIRDGAMVTVKGLTYCGGFLLIVMNHHLSMSSHFRGL